MNLESSSGGTGNYIITGLAILGIALGGTSLYVGLAGRGSETERENRISELEQQVSRLSGANEELNGNIRGLYNQTRTSFQNVSDQLALMRDEMKAKSPATTPAATPAAGAAATPPAEGAGGTYAIRAGDLLGKVAKEQGTTVDKILKANPGLNPNRLKVGQVINLP